MLHTYSGTRVAESSSGGWRIFRTCLIVLLVLVLAGGGTYLGLCWWTASQKAFLPGYHIENVDVGGMTAEQAAQALKTELLGRTFPVWLDKQEGDPIIVLTAEQLGLLPDGSSTDYLALAQAAYRDCRSGTFLSGGYDYFRAMRQGSGTFRVLSPSADDACKEAARTAVRNFTVWPTDAGYTVDGAYLMALTPVDGRSAHVQTLAEALMAVRLEPRAEDRCVVIPSVPLPASRLTAQYLREQIYREPVMARYDQATGTIVPDIPGVDLDVEAAQQLMDAAVPGTYAALQLTELPAAVSDETLASVLFRDVLATYTTEVDGTAARKNNVKLSAKAINGFVLNHGDLFSYNEVVGKRTTARGYQAAPAYVNGKTVDEIGGGICQTSSTLYMSCLLANLEITQRRPHRYATAYMPLGMDATVSWGGPDYQFTNNTLYPIRIETVYQNDRLTVTLYGTKTDDIQVKMSYKQLEKIDWSTDYIDDPTLPAGTEIVETSAYVGYKVQTYRELYDGTGSLISKTKEAYSYYKARNRVVLRGTALPEGPTIPAGPGGWDEPFPSDDSNGALTPDKPLPPSLPDDVTPPACVCPIRSTSRPL